MKIENIKSLSIAEIKSISFARFVDERGYFTETIRPQDLQQLTEVPIFSQVTWQQTNESYSIANVVRGLHFQWDNHMGKLVRAIEGRLIDLMMDIRLGSQTYGKIIGQSLYYDPTETYQEWIWIPPGFAHGFVAITDCRIEYICTSTWSPKTERAISLLDPTIDWSMMEKELVDAVKRVLTNPIIADKDRNGLTLSSWQTSDDAKIYMQTLPKV